MILLHTDEKYENRDERLNSIWPSTKSHVGATDLKETSGERMNVLKQGTTLT